MNNPESLSRRGFLQSTGTLTGAAYLRMLAPGLAAITQAACSANDQGMAFAVLGTDEARDFGAIAARIIPTTDTPGATEAGVIHFIDKAFAAEMSGQLEFARAGLAEFNDALRSKHASAAHLGDLSEDEQDAFLQTRETSGLFNLMWAMTIFGFFAMEKYGGNRDQVGWDLIGFEGSHGPWQYPFGYYDAQVHGETNDGE
jgi:gluconate 2-dehydrogenase gamma chain